MAEEKIRDPSEIFLVAIVTTNEDGTMGGGQCAGIEHEGKKWLVPQWIDIPSEKVSTPERIICLEGLPYQPGASLEQLSFATF